MQYDVFISCKSEDYKYAEEIYEFLEANGIHTFLASKELRTLGESEYRRAISAAMKSTCHMIVFASDAEYIDSTWVYYEWDMYINAKLKGFKSGQIVTILKDVNVDDINMDLWKYESFTFDNYKEKLLSYAETPSSLKRREEAKKKREEEERVKRQQEEILKKQKKAKEELIALAEAYRRKVADLNSIDAKKLVAALRAVGVTTHACPVCNTNVGVDKFYCPTCGWSISPIDHVEGAEYLSLINTEQLEVVREIHRKLIAADDTVTLNANLQEENQTLRDKIVELSEQVERVEAQSLWNEQRLTDARRQREELEQYSLALLEKFKTLEQENANLQDKLLSLQTESQKNVHSIHSKYLPYADLPNKAVFEKALDKDVEACREMARRYYYGLNGYKKNVDSANNYLMKVGLPLYETEGDSSILPQQNNIEGHPKSLKFTYNGKDFYMILSPDKTYYVGNVKAANGDFSWLNSSWMQIGGGAALTAGAIALGVLAWPMAVALFIKALGTWTNDKERKNNIQKLCDELSKSSGYKFAKPTEKELEGVKQEEKDFCIVLRVKENPNLIPTKEKSSTAKEIKKEVEYKVKLLSVGRSRYKVVNSIMNTTSVNEAEAEYLVQKVPCELFGSYSFEEAQKIMHELELNGAKVAISEL